MFNGFKRTFFFRDTLNRIVYFRLKIMVLFDTTVSINISQLIDKDYLRNKFSVMASCILCV